MRTKIMPFLWSANYCWMAKTQSGVSSYFYSQGRPVRCSDYYEKKAREEDAENRRRAIGDFHRQTAPARQRWETYLAARPAKIAPLAKAYGTKKAGPQTFVRETGGLALRVQFVGYFRGGGYECMTCSIGPVYAVHAGILGIPSFISHGELFQKMNRDWGVIQYINDAVDADKVKKNQ